MEGEQKSLRARGNRGHEWPTCELTESEAACTGPAQVCIRWGPKAERSGHMPHP